MKKLIAGLVSAILFTATAQAGLGLSSAGVAVTDLGEGFTLVEGTMSSVRFTDDDVQLIGCRVRGNRGAPASVVCRARDINNVLYLCFSFDPALIEAGKSISPYSYVRFVRDDETAECDSLLVSTRSFHIPDKDMEKGKSK
jgi:hypothetical protein